VTPLVGITAYPPNALNRYELPAEYVTAVRRAGAVPVLIPPGETDVDGLLARLDGVILAGGGDVDPAHWGGERDETNEFVDPARDDLELALARRVLDDGIPTLAVCRGIQVVNTALGGTLHNHLPDAVESDVPHRQEPKWGHTHGVEAEAGSLVAEIMGADRVEIACWHHQAIATPGAGLAITAWSPDGVIEAVELAGHPWMIAVQWHPEMTAADDQTQQALFDGLVGAIDG
jgi:putative glutamine amidotransferase